MNILIIYESKFKTNQMKIEDVLRHFGLRKIQNQTFIGKLDKTELDEIKNEFSKKINQKESVLVIPLCETCYSKKEIFGKTIKFKEDLYRVF